MDLLFVIFEVFWSKSRVLGQIGRSGKVLGFISSNFGPDPTAGCLLKGNNRGAIIIIIIPEQLQCKNDCGCPQSRISAALAIYRQLPPVRPVGGHRPFLEQGGRKGGGEGVGWPGGGFCSAGIGFVVLIAVAAMLGGTWLTEGY